MNTMTFAPRYHIYAGRGWINDPNGLIRINGRYHVFYQFYPYSTKWGPMHWGHVCGTDLAHWTREPIALKPDQNYEQGCFSGSAVNDGGILTLVYTAHDDRKENKETQCIARSLDGGATFVKAPENPVIPAAPEGFGTDFRDPKVFQKNGEWRMVVGCTRNGRGCTLLYKSKDLISWEYLGVFAESDGTLGSMWECPNYCRVNGQDLLILSPIGMDGHKSIALFGTYENDRMRLSGFQDLDFGEDFYAAQVFTDGDRTILMAWMHSWDKQYSSESEGWAGLLTIPRVLSVQNGMLLQEPVPELQLLREKEILNATDLNNLRGRCMELRMRVNGAFTFTVADSENTQMTLKAEGDRAELVLPSGRISRARIPANEENDLIVYVDHSSVECFINGIACSVRICPTDYEFTFHLDGQVLKANAWSLANAFQES